MQYHTLSIVRELDAEVDVVALGGSKPVDDIVDNVAIRQHDIWTPPFHKLPRRFFLFYAPIKVMWQVIMLLWTLLFVIPSPKGILVQNPPSIPVLAICRLTAWLRKSMFIIDWHNFGYTILALSQGKNHPLVRISKIYERVVGRLGDEHLCVTNAMKDFLHAKWRIKASTLYDRPPSFFKPLARAEKEKFLARFGQTVMRELERVGASCSKADGSWPEYSTLKEETAGGVELFVNGNRELHCSRPALVVSSTSWTPDEDFGVLFEAVKEADMEMQEKAKNGVKQGRVLVVVTGKGPMKAAFEKELSSTPLAYFRIITVWLEIEDYPKLLGSADLGVSLHTSSSGLDLPMKVVDMFGCGLPVCAIDFPCLDELVKEGQNGRVFSSASGLSRQMLSLLQGLPRGNEDLAALRRGTETFRRIRWDDAWRVTAKPKFLTR